VHVDPDLAEDVERLRVSFVVPVYLQGLDYRENPMFGELALRATAPHPGGLKVVLPWIRWKGFAGYLSCVEFARHQLRGIPRGQALTLNEETPARYHAVGIVLLAQALADNLAVWLSEQLHLRAAGGEQSFLRQAFRKAFTTRLGGGAANLLQKHEPYLNELNTYRQVWVHRHAGGGVLMSDDCPDLPTSHKFVGIPIDPAFDHFAADAHTRAEGTARAHGGRYLYEAAEFADRIATGVRNLFFDVLRLSLDNIA